MKTNRTWILVADHSGARVLENHGPEKGLLEVPGMSFMLGSEQFADPEPHHIPTIHPRFMPGLCATDWPRDPAQERFAHELANALNKKYREGAFDRLVLVGSPRILQHLRQLLSTDARRCLKAELPRAVSSASDADVASRIAPVLQG